jgi:hypothetical protein
LQAAKEKTLAAKENVLDDKMSKNVADLVELNKMR